MSAIPLELPIRAGDAAALADTVFQLAESRPLTDDLRRRIAARLAGQRFETIRPYPGSLAQDPVHMSAYFIAIDAMAQASASALLLRIAFASAPASALFPNAMLIARTRSGHNREFVINAVPFTPLNRSEIFVFGLEVDRAFLPRPLGAHPEVPILTNEPEVALPAAFQAYRQVLRASGQNVASVVCRDQEPERYFAVALWAAIRAGWREGFSAALCVSLAGGIESAKETIRRGWMYSKFVLIVDSGELLPDVRSQFQVFIRELKAGQHLSKHFDLVMLPASEWNPVSDPAMIVERAAGLRR